MKFRGWGPSVKTKFSKINFHYTRVKCSPNPRKINSRNIHIMYQNTKSTKISTVKLPVPCIYGIVNLELITERAYYTSKESCKLMIYASLMSSQCMTQFDCPYCLLSDKPQNVTLRKCTMYIIMMNHTYYKIIWVFFFNDHCFRTVLQISQICIFLICVLLHLCTRRPSAKSTACR